MTVAATLVTLLAQGALWSAEPEARGSREAIRLAIAEEDASALRSALAALAGATSVDAAAQAFVQAIEAVPRNHQFRARFEAALAHPETPTPKGTEAHWLFILVPGWLYLADPETGADLSRVQSVLSSLGLASRRVPLEENGTIEANAQILADYVERLEVEARRLILVSTSKGGPETHLALHRLQRADHAKHVAAWVNIGGLLNGTAVADHWSTWPRSWLAAVGFALRGHGTASIESMRTDAGRTRFASVSLPPHLLVVNYLGVPMAADIHSGVRDRYELLSKDGPNDGLTLLADAIVPQGVTLVGRGLDHFLADPNQDRIVAAMALAVLDTLGDQHSAHGSLYRARARALQAPVLGLTVVGGRARRVFTIVTECAANRPRVAPSRAAEPRRPISDWRRTARTCHWPAAGIGVTNVSTTSVS
jgi:hypothetical protein